MLLAIAPIVPATILEPEDAGRRVGRDVLRHWRADDSALELEDLLARVRVAYGLVVQAALYAIVGCLLAHLQRLGKLGYSLAQRIKANFDCYVLVNIEINSIDLRSGGSFVRLLPKNKASEYLLNICNLIPFHAANYFGSPF